MRTRGSAKYPQPPQYHILIRKNHWSSHEKISQPHVNLTSEFALQYLLSFISTHLRHACVVPLFTLEPPCASVATAVEQIGLLTGST